MRKSTHFFHWLWGEENALESEESWTANKTTIPLFQNDHIILSATTWRIKNNNNKDNNK